MDTNDKVIRALLLIFGTLGIFSGVMWTFTQPNNPWLWFSRFTSGVYVFRYLCDS